MVVYISTSNVETSKLCSNETSSSKNLPKWVAKTIETMGVDAGNPFEPRRKREKINRLMAKVMDAKDLETYQWAKGKEECENAMKEEYNAWMKKILRSWRHFQ